MRRKRGRPRKDEKKEAVNWSDEKEIEIEPPMPPDVIAADAESRGQELTEEENNDLVREEEQAEVKPKVMPENELELNYYFTNPQWSDDSINANFQDKLKRTVVKRAPKDTIVKDENGNKQVSDGTILVTENQDFWADLAFLTRDLRLANYDRATYNYCAYMYELAGSLFNAGYYRAGILALEKGAIHGEMSQGKGGFLRKMQNTLIQQSSTQLQEIKKNSILSKQPKHNEGGFQ